MSKAASRSAYAEKYRDPRWQKLRLEIMSRDEWACRDCGDKGSTLQVHHMYYVKGRDPWEYPAFSLVCLCDGCHESRHNYSRETIDEDEHYQPMKEWELSVDMISNGGREELWDLGCEIAMAAKVFEGGYNQVFGYILSFLREETQAREVKLKK